MNTAAKLSYSVDEACMALGLPRTTFYAAIRDGQIQTFKAGRRRMVSRKALEDFITKLERQSAKGAA